MTTKNRSRNVDKGPRAEAGVLVFGRMPPEPKRSGAPRDRSGQSSSVVSKVKAAGRALYGAAEVAPDVLQSNLREFLRQMNDIIDVLPTKLGEFGVDSVELTVEVTAKGEVGLFGSGAALEGKGGITFSLKRTKPSPPEPR